jgi:hypothetical protein
MKARQTHPTADHRSFRPQSSETCSTPSPSSKRGQLIVERAALALLIAFVTGIAGCGGEDCSGSEGGINVRLLNGANGDLCTGNVSIDQGGTSDSLSCTVEGSDCVCVGAQGKPGNYFVTASRGGTVIGTSGAVVEEGSCEAVELQFSL